jgi:hypothetical protein
VRAAGARRCALGLLLALLLGLDGRAAADDLASAQALYEQGQMRAAARLARAVGGAEGLTLAARAALVDALYLAARGDQSALLERAVRDARQALALDPGYQPAYLQLALALGQIAERAGPIAAHLEGYAREGRALLERAQALAPEDPWPDGLLGIWHLQLVRHGSAMLAAELYGASEAEGLRLCRRAAERAPAAIALRYGCAVSMLQLDAGRLGREALRALVEVVRLPAADAAERLVQRAAGRQVGALRRSADR